MDASDRLVRLSAALGLRCEMQDWGIINADPKRIEEFIEFAQSAPTLTSGDYCDLGELILASANELLVSDPEASLRNVDAFIGAHLTEIGSVVEYWRSLNDPVQFPLATHLRKQAENWPDQA